VISITGALNVGLDKDN